MPTKDELTEENEKLTKRAEAAEGEAEALRAQLKEMEADGGDASLREELEATKEKLAKANEMVADLKSRMGSMTMAAAEHSGLSHDEVAAAIEKDPSTEFQVVKDYKFMGMRMKAGRKLSARHYPQLLSYVKDGLRLIHAA